MISDYNMGRLSGLSRLGVVVFHGMVKPVRTQHLADAARRSNTNPAHGDKVDQRSVFNLQELEPFAKIPVGSSSLPPNKLPRPFCRIAPA